MVRISTDENEYMDRIVRDLQSFLGPVGANELILAFLIDTKESQQEIAQALSLRDFEQVRKLAHRLKGCSTAVMADKLEIWAVQFEALAESHDLQSLLALYPELEQLLVPLRQFLQQHLQQAGKEDFGLD